MRKLMIFLNMLILLLTMMFALNMYLTVNEIGEELNAERKTNDRRIEELEKEIRVLKTDIDILQYGFEKEER